MTGVLLVDKPAGPTSHDIVQRIRRVAGLRKVGHTGTLDPAATGLLALCLGRATRLAEFLTGMDKTYEGVLRLGITTSSHDLEGEVLEERPVPTLGTKELETAFSVFTGNILQKPPMLSAVKVDGERLYKRARRGEHIDRPARPVTIYEFSLTAFDGRDVQFRLRCSSGTYARVLCADVGQRLGCGGTLAALRRVAVGDHHVNDAAMLDSLDSAEAIRARLLPLERALSLPEVKLLDGARERVRHGHSFGTEVIAGEYPSQSGWVQVKASSGELLALAEVHENAHGVRIQPRRVLCDG